MERSDPSRPGSVVLTRSGVDGAGAEAGTDHRLAGHRSRGGVPEAARAADGRAWAHLRIDIPGSCVCGTMIRMRSVRAPQRGACTAMICSAAGRSIGVMAGQSSIMLQLRRSHTACHAHRRVPGIAI